MKPFSLRALCATLATTAALIPATHAEDIDLFTTPAGGSANAPNILIIIDNSANWSRADQQWATGKQGESELKAIRDVLNDNSVQSVNLGLMMMVSGNTAEPDGAYIRFAVRSMADATNRKAFQDLIGKSLSQDGIACVAGANFLTGGPNCILQNYADPVEKTNNANYSAALFEAYKYFGGYTDPANANKPVPNTPTPYIQDRNHFGQLRYGILDTKADPAAYQDAARTKYRSPIDVNKSCAKNYIIFIGNGYPASDADVNLLKGINGDIVNPACIGNKCNHAANWAKYLFTTDVHEMPNKQNVAIYAIDVFNAKPDPDNQTKLLHGMSDGYGGGRYFEAKNAQQILDALREVMLEIQSVNSVFASASLPINATNRSQNENQVFIGMFRPDPDAKPKWYGNLKQYQVAFFGSEAKLADKDGREAMAASTGFLQPCATSFWTTDSGNYWSFSPDSAGNCPTAPAGVNSDLPDGSVVEKGGAGEVLRKGNNPSATAPFVVNRNVYTCASAPCASLVAFNATNVTQARTGATATDHPLLIDFALGKDVKDENGNANLIEPRPSIQGDIVHSRPLPVNFGGSRGVVIYYGTNDGVLRAIDGKTGVEQWAFVAPEHHSKLKRLYDNSPIITYPGLGTSSSRPKDYFFDGSAGLYQNADNSKVLIFPTMRRGGRMLYAFDVSGTNPVYKWSVGCPNLADDAGCTAGFSAMGQTWSVPNVAFVKGYGSATPVLVVGGGYDSCEDTDAAVTTCTNASKGNKVYVLNAETGQLLQSFNTDRPVAADVTLLDRDFDGMVDHGYAADVEGSIYRIDFVDPATNQALAAGSWRFNKIARTTGSGRKFLFGASALVAGDKVYLAIGSGDRERPLKDNYPYRTPVQNRFYMLVDALANPNTVIDLDGSTMQNFTSGTDCNTLLESGKNGWFMDLTAGKGEQVVTSSVIFGGAVFFSTNRPLQDNPGTCGANLGEANGYAVNLLNASGVIGSGSLCGGARNGVFTGGALPPSPVVGTIPVKDPTTGQTRMINVLIGGVNLKTGDVGGSCPLCAQNPPVPIKQVRQRVYWYPKGDQ